MTQKTSLFPKLPQTALLPHCFWLPQPFSAEDRATETSGCVWPVISLPAFSLSMGPGVLSL